MNEPKLQREQFLERPLPSSPDAERVIRSCSFCEFRAAYEDFPDDSICFNGICACADCLNGEKTENFRNLLIENGTQ